MLQIKRAYEPPAEEDGLRILVDRLWPRGISKAKAKLYLWLKDIAPTNELRRWFGHDPEKWTEFKERYLKELQDKPEVGKLRELAATQTVTLIFAARDEGHNEAVVLRDLLRSQH